MFVQQFMNVPHDFNFYVIDSAGASTFLNVINLQKIKKRGVIIFKYVYISFE